MNWKKTFAAVMLSAALVVPTSAQPVLAGAVAVREAQASSPAAHKLTATVRAGLDAAFSERTPDGTVFGVVISLESTAARVTRVPDFELRVEAGDGTVYTLQPSQANPRSLQPKGKVELGYLLQLDRVEPIKPVRLMWVEIDDYVYPRKETTLLSLNMEGQVWEPARSGYGGVHLTPWGEPFRLQDEPLISLTPTAMEQRATEQGRVYVVTIKAVNESDEKRYVPAFTVGVADEQTLIAGVATTADWPALNPGEARNVHFAVSTREDIQINEIVVLTPEPFVMASSPGLPGEHQVFHVGRVRMALPSGEEAAAKLAGYAFGQPIDLDPDNGLISKDIEVSLMELHLHDNQDEGYQTAVAKFKVHNSGKNPIPLPHFGAELVSRDGYAYAGDRQLIVAHQLMPGLSHIVSYAFQVPKSETEEAYTLRILDDADSPYAAVIAAVPANVQWEQADNTWHLYPFHVKLNRWTVHAYSDTVPVVNYSYKMILDVDIERVEDTVVDGNFSRLKIELADLQGRVLGHETIPFIGIGRLISGRQTIIFDQIRAEQHQYPLTINIYETIDTPSGEANRLIQTMVQKY